MSKLNILGIAGTDGSGKDTIGEMLAKKHGWLFISVTDLLRAELIKQNKKLTRSNLRKVSAQWRRQSGKGVLVDRAYEMYLIKNKANQFQGLAIASLRNPGEVDRVHELGGGVIWVDAEPNVRYKRILKRKKGTEDDVTFEEFTKEESEQMEHQGDDATLSLSGVKAKADIFLDNSDDNLEGFKKESERALSSNL